MSDYPAIVKVLSNLAMGSTSMRPKLSVRGGAVRGFATYGDLSLSCCGCPGCVLAVAWRPSLLKYKTRSWVQS